MIVSRATPGREVVTVTWFPVTATVPASAGHNVARTRFSGFARSNSAPGALRTCAVVVTGSPGEVRSTRSSVLGLSGPTPDGSGSSDVDAWIARRPRPMSMAEV